MTIRARVLASLMLLTLTFPMAAQTPAEEIHGCTGHDRGPGAASSSAVVTKVSNFAAVPAAPPGPDAARPGAAADHDRQMYVQFQIPQQKRARMAGDHGARLHAHGAALSHP
jgi:hypothetical protein